MAKKRTQAPTNHAYLCRICSKDSEPGSSSSYFFTLEDMLEHVLQVHRMIDEDYQRLHGIDPIRITPDPPPLPEMADVEGEEDGDTAKNMKKIQALNREAIEAKEKELIDYYVEAKGLPADDPRLQLACFYQAAAHVMQTEIRENLSKLQSYMDFEARDSVATRVIAMGKDLKTWVSEARDAITSLSKEISSQQEGKGIEVMFSETMRDAEEFIKKFQGEFHFQCGDCGAFVLADGLPIPYLTYQPDPKRPGFRMAYIGSPEFFHALNQGIISLSEAAFLLRTSPEGLKYTAERRGEPLAMFEGKDKDASIAILVEHEKFLRQIRDHFEETEIEKLEQEKARMEELKRLAEGDESQSDKEGP